MNHLEFSSYLLSSKCPRDEHVSKAMSLIMMYYKKHKSKVSPDEREDLFMDLICQVYSLYDIWEGESYTEFCSFVYFKLMDWEKRILTKYTGIKVSRSDVRNARIYGTPIELKKVEYNEEIWFNPIK